MSNQSEGFPRTGYFIPAHVGTGAGQIWEILPPAPSGQFFGKKLGFWKSTFFSRLGLRKEISARHYRQIARNYVARLFLKSANSKKKFLFARTTQHHTSKKWGFPKVRFPKKNKFLFARTTSHYTSKKFRFPSWSRDESSFPFPFWSRDESSSRSHSDLESYPPDPILI